ncbi:transposase [Jiella sp. CQZ9-1]|uniref:Transposase n=1 Tax=Jiella flava TaxID=2816857 RepID=A0A939FZT0_9HYPH|nr:transposase [Jiella flava]
MSLLFPSKELSTVPAQVHKSLGVKIRRVMTDNGACYKSKALRKTCRDLGLKHVRTKPDTPKTNGKAERFIQAALREWAYGNSYQTSQERANALPFWNHLYNWHRPHGGINDQTPISRLGFNRDNLLRHHS